MKRNGKRVLTAGCIVVLLFVGWTWLIQNVDVQPTGQNGTDVGFSTLNHWFHKLTGANMTLYSITDWLGLVPIAVCMIFGGLGLIQLIKRRSLLKVDADIIILGIYYILVVLGYLVFEMIPINYRPIPINGIMEVSYPSSTTLLVLCVMPTLAEQVERRIKSGVVRMLINVFAVFFAGGMVAGRLLSGVHWLTDIVGSILLSGGLFCIYRAAVMLSNKEKMNRGINMEFHEKLQELRKNRGLTQEELAEALYVSRTAISKWESGKGYPSIDSLKEISKFFSVTIDALLSGEKLISVAEKENKANLRSVCDLLFGIVDVCAFLLMILPLYPKTVEGHIYSVNLFSYTEATGWIRVAYWILFGGLIACGVVKVVLNRIELKRGNQVLMYLSLGLNSFGVVFLALTREAYAIVVVFLLLVIKGVLLSKSEKAKG